MSTEFYNRNWRMPKSSNSNKVSNYSMSFDGSSEYIDLGSDTTLNIGGDLSISAWVFVNAHKNFNFIISKFTDGSNRNYELYVRNEGNVTFVSNSNSTNSTTTIPINTWTHLIVSVESGVTNGTKFYFNGTLDGTTSTTTVVSQTNATTIGRRSTGLYNFNGKLDHLSIFDYALSSSQVTSLYGNSTDGVGNPMSLNPKPKAYYPIGDYAAFNGSEYLVTNAASEVYSPYALNFDAASSDYIDLGTDSSLDIFGGDFSVSLWFNHTIALPSRQPLIEIGYFANKMALTLGNTNNTGVGFAVGPSNPPVWNFNAGSGYNDGNWHHMVATRTGTTHKIFVDNTELSFSTGFWSVGSLNRIAVGRSSPVYFDGSISNISIWNAALTSTQITELYGSAAPTNLNNHSAYSNLVSWWQLGENSSFDGTNWIVLDEKGTNNGTSANMGEDAIVNGVGTSANGLSSGMGGADNIVGDAPQNSTGNAVSYGMGVDAKSTSVPS